MRKSRLSCYKQSKLIELFVAGTTARTAAFLQESIKQQQVSIIIYLKMKLKPMKIILVVGAKVNVIEVQQGKIHPCT
jgi:transposase-like protein